jgi:diguanylate cyclase (GGDEF)-like protein
MTADALNLLLIDTDGATVPDIAATSAFGPFVAVRVQGLAEAALRLAGQRFDGVVVAVTNLEARRLLSWNGLSQAVADGAVVVLTTGDPGSELAVRLVHAGVQDVLPLATDPVDALPRAVRLGIERKSQDRQTRKAYATDLMTGLPNQSQLIEHVNQLLALREREPAPMALMAVRVEGLATAEARHGEESANVLRRKIAVRLRMGLRASDVVASVGADTFVVLLSKFQEAQDAERVADKLREALHPPFPIAGSEVAVAVAIGTAHHPADGRDAATLLRRAVGLATSGAASGRDGFANHLERGAVGAANDEPND